MKSASNNKIDIAVIPYPLIDYKYLSRFAPLMNRVCSIGMIFFFFGGGGGGGRILSMHKHQ